MHDIATPRGIASGRAESRKGGGALDEELNFLIKENYRAGHVPCMYIS